MYPACKVNGYPYNVAIRGGQSGAVKGAFLPYPSFPHNPICPLDTYITYDIITG